MSAIAARGTSRSYAASSSSDIPARWPRQVPPRRIRVTPFAERWRSYNSWLGAAAGTTAQRILEDGRLGAPGGVRRARYCRAGSHCAGVRIYAMGRRQRRDHLARHRTRDVDRLPLDAARATQAPTQAVVDAADAHPRLRQAQFDAFGKHLMPI